MDKENQFVTLNILLIVTTALVSSSACTRTDKGKEFQINIEW